VDRGWADENRLNENIKLKGKYQLEITPRV